MTDYTSRSTRDYARAIPPGIFRAGVIGFRPYGDAIPQSINVPRAYYRTGIRNWTCPFANDLAFSAYRHPAVFFPVSQRIALTVSRHAVARQAIEIGNSQCLTPVIVPAHYKRAGQEFQQFTPVQWITSSGILGFHVRQIEGSKLIFICPQNRLPVHTEHGPLQSVVDYTSNLIHQVQLFFARPGLKIRLAANEDVILQSMNVTR